MQPRTLRGITAQLRSSASQPRLITSLLALAGMLQGATPRRCSMRSNQGCKVSLSKPLTACSLAQCLRVSGGVRKLEVQLIKVVDRKSTRLNSSHVRISYAVFCLKKKNNKNTIKTT